VFYGYLSLAFGWGFYAVVFICFGIALYSQLKEGDIYITAERFINGMVTLGVLNLSVATVFAFVATVRWLLGF
jgi:hypothetical protein